MNRAEKRRLEREKSRAQATYTLTQAQIDQMKKDVSLEATERAFLIMLGFPMLALRDLDGYGKKRMNRFINKVLRIYEHYQDDYLSLEDLHRTITDETGVDLRERIPS